MSGRGPRVVAVLGVLGLLAACTGPVDVPDPGPGAPATQDVCPALMAALPAVVEDGTRREVTAPALTAAWGDPPITLRCGVPAPPGLTPSSECLEVDGVGWFSEDVATGVLFTTIGRAAFVEVGVPAGYTPAVNPLVDLADAVTAHVPVQQPCR